MEEQKKRVELEEQPRQELVDIGVAITNAKLRIADLEIQKLTLTSAIVTAQQDFNKKASEAAVAMGLDVENEDWQLNTQDWYFWLKE